MHDADAREPCPGDAKHARPGHVGFLAAPAESAPPEPDDSVAKGCDRRKVQGHRVVVDVATNHRGQPPTHLGDGSGASAAGAAALISCSFARTLLRDVCRKTVNRPFRVFPQTCVKPRKSNVSGLPRPAALSVRRRTGAEFDQSRLVGVQFEPVCRESVAEFGQESPGFLLVLKAHDEVVGVTDHDHVARGLPRASRGPRGRTRSAGRCSPAGVRSLLPAASLSHCASTPHPPARQRSAISG